MSVLFCPFCGKPLPQPHAPTCPFCGGSLAHAIPPAGAGADSTSPSPTPHSIPLPPRPATPRPSQPVSTQPFSSQPVFPPYPTAPTYPTVPTQPVFPPYPTAPTYPTVPTQPVFSPYPTVPTYPAVPPQPVVTPYLAPAVPVVPVWGMAPGAVYAPAATPLAPVPPTTFSLTRVLSVTLCMLAVAVFGTYAFWHIVAGSDMSTTGAGAPPSWAWLLTEIFNSHHISPLPPALFALAFGYPLADTPPATYVTLLHEREFAVMVVALVPMALASAFWLGLRRLPQQRRGSWLDASFMCVSLFIVTPCVLGAESYGLTSLSQQQDNFHTFALWPVILLAAVPGYLVLLVVLALVCAAVGTWCAAIFARWPRVAPGTAMHPRGGAPIFLITFAAALLQSALYTWLTQTVMRGASIGWQWFPLVATLIITGAALSRALPER